MTEKPSLTLLLAGHVDHGKSTLAAALLHALGQMPEGKAEAIARACAARGQAFEWAFALDALAAERAQNVTMDAGYIWLDTPRWRIRLIDAPGHREFLAAMLTGATQADAALLVIDATEGAQEQTRRHIHLLRLLGITQVIVAVNKMDAVGYNEARFSAIKDALREQLPASLFIPVSAREGKGLTPLVEALDAITPPPALDRLPLRLPVQDVYKREQVRVLAGRIESGALAVGDEVLLSPSGTTARIASIETWPESGATRATAGQSIAVTLDRDVFVQRGMVLSHADQPPAAATQFTAQLFWLGQPLVQNKRYRLHVGLQETTAELMQIEPVHDTIMHATFRTRTPLALDTYADNPVISRLIVLEQGMPSGGGLVQAIMAQVAANPKPVKSSHITPQAQTISIAERARVNGHLPGIFWFSGLSGAGKSTLAQGLQKALFSRGAQVFVLDGDNLRGGLSRDLGFSPPDRLENLRRAGEVAALFASAGFIVIAAFISPTEADRQAARACAPDWFHHIHIRASLNACEERDVKGLYALARKGEIAEFTGISAAFEEPAAAELVIDAETAPIEACVKELLHYVEQACIAPLHD